MQIEEHFTYDRTREAKQVYRTDDLAHPGVEAINAQGTTLVGGAVRVFALPPDPEFPDYRLTPAQSLTAATLNAAWVLGLHEQHGALEAGKRADFLVLDADDTAMIAYRPGHNPVAEVWLAGTRVA